MGAVTDAIRAKLEAAFSPTRLVISDDSRIPSKNARVRVRGEVKEVGLFGGRSFGLHIREKSIKYL